MLMMQASPPQGFPFFGMPPSVLSALSRTDLQMAVTSNMSDGIRTLLASAHMVEQQAAASGTHTTPLHSASLVLPVDPLYVRQEPLGPHIEPV